MVGRPHFEWQRSSIELGGHPETVSASRKCGLLALELDIAVPS